VTSPPSWRARFACAAVLGVLTAAYADLFWSHPRPKPSDFTQPWAAARILAHGQNPYELIGPGRAFEHQWPLVYPATAAVVAMPFAWAPPRLADALFIGCGAALLAWALTCRTLANPQLWVFASFPMMVAAQNVQWSPWLTAAVVMPAFGFLLAAKPSIGLAMLTAYPSRAALLGSAIFALLTIAIWPWWVSAWIAALPSLTHMSAPVTRWGGPLILLALLKWRRPEARLLAALACIPQTPVLYEVVPLFLLVRTFREAALLVVLTGVAGRIVNAIAVGADYHTWMAINGQWMVWLVYMPCTAMILLRPNEGLTLDWRAFLPARPGSKYVAAGLLGPRDGATAGNRPSKAA
jgi:hypothetical protein